MESVDGGVNKKSTKNKNKIVKFFIKNKTDSYQTKIINLILNYKHKNNLSTYTQD